MPTRIGDDRQYRQHRNRRENSRHDQFFDRIRSQSPHGIDLFRHEHGAQFRSHTGTDAASHHQGGENRTEFADERDGNQSSCKSHGAERRERFRGLQGQNGAREEARQHHDRERPNTDQIHLHQDVANVKRAAKHRGESLAGQEGQLLHFLDGSFQRKRHPRHRSGKFSYTRRMLSFRTAGESHGPALIALVEGIPAHLPIDFEFIDHELKRRQGGYGRGGRMKIEKDQVRFLSGVRHGKTIGSPIAMMIENRDWPNWEEIMSAREVLSDAADQTASHAAASGPYRFGRIAQVSTTPMPATFSNGPAPAKPRPGWRGRAGKGLSCGTSASRYLAIRLPSASARVPDDYRVSWEQLESIRDDEVVRCIVPEMAKQMVRRSKRPRKTATRSAAPLKSLRVAFR